MNWQNTHKLNLSILLKSITKSIPELIFKGGTSMLFFLDLPRFSVDLDFDLYLADSDTDKQENLKIGVFEKIGQIIKSTNMTVKSSYIKRQTIFFLVSYSDGTKNIKIEISTRSITLPKTNVFNFYGSHIQVLDRNIQLCFKIVALCTRKQPRDLFDIVHYIDKNISCHRNLVEKIYFIIDGKQKSFSDILAQAKSVVQSFDNKSIMVGLGELLYDDKQKQDLKNNFLDQAMMYLDNLKIV